MTSTPHVLPAAPRRLRAASAALALGLLLAGCSFEPPPPDLRTTMFQIDFAEKEAAQSVASAHLLPVAAQRAGDILELARSDAFDRYVQHPTYAFGEGDRPRFATFHQNLIDAATGLQVAAASGDTAAAQRAVARLEMACQLCHAHFRPGL